MKRLLAMTVGVLVLLAGTMKGEETNKIVLLTPELDAKLSAIMIPGIQWKNTSLPDAVAYLNAEAKKADPDQKGVEIVLKTTADRTITFVVKQKISLKAALTALCRFTKLTMVAEGGKVVVQPKGGDGEGPAF